MASVRAPRNPAGSVRVTASRGASGSNRTKAAIPQLSWSAARPAAVVLISGPEDILATRAGQLIREQLVGQDSVLEVSDIDAADYAAGELITFASPSLFDEPRLIRVSQVERCNDAFLEECLSYLDSPAEGATVVLRHGGGVRGKKLLDAVRGGAGQGIEVVCAELKRDSDRFDFARDEFRRAGREIAPAALRALVEAFTGNLAELAAACLQLIEDVPDNTPITVALVDRYYGGRVEAGAFRVADAALAGRPGEALVQLRHALSAGEDPVPMVAALASKVRTMARLYGQRGPSGQLASRFAVSPWQVDRAREDLQGWNSAGLSRAVQALAATDSEVKGAARDPLFSLERLVRLLAARGQPVESNGE